MPQFLIKTFTGLESVLARELAELGATDVRPVSRGVLCAGAEKLMYRANLELRTGLRVYRHLGDIEGESPESLYDEVSSYPWERHLETTGSLYVTSTVSQTEWVENSMIVTLKTKDAIVDRLRRGELRPDVDRERPNLRVHTYLHRGRGSLWLDTTGDPLFKRGYRLRTMAAPINEVLAAGILALAEYRPTVALVDPMCGSGTFAVEAARMALKIPAQIERRYFAFMELPDYDPETWNLVRQQAIARIYKGVIADIIASDIDGKAVRYAQQNIREAGLAKRVQLHHASLFDVSAPQERGMLVLNPPYDERLAVHDGRSWYHEVGSALKHYWSGWDAFVVSGFTDGLVAMSLSPEQTFELDNGGIPVQLWKLPLYRGSKKEKSGASLSLKRESREEE